MIFYSKSVLKNAIKKGGSSIQNFTNTDGDTGFFQKQFKVYQRENLKCTNKNCSGIIKKKIFQIDQLSTVIFVKNIKLISWP